MYDPAVLWVLLALLYKVGPFLRPEFSPLIGIRSLGYLDRMKLRTLNTYEERIEPALLRLKKIFWTTVWLLKRGWSQSTIDLGIASAPFNILIARSFIVCISTLR